MLILSRKQGDAVLLDGGIRIVVLGFDSGGVRLGIEAPRSVSIVREEIVSGIADENVRAGATAEGKEWLDQFGGGSSAPEETPDADDEAGDAEQRVEGSE